MRKVLFFLIVLGICSCTSRKFQVSGTISDAKDSILYFENMSLNGAVVIDSVKLDDEGAFKFSDDAPTAPEFYRLRIARQIINVAVDSTESISIKASYPSMSSKYEVEGSEECSRIQELAYKQQELQARVNAYINNPENPGDSVRKVVPEMLAAYKNAVKTDYIFKDPKLASSYFALFQTIQLGYNNMLIFNPHSSEEDVKVFAAVATSWDTFFPKAERGLNLHNIAIEGMKNVRIIQASQNQTLDPDKVTTSGVIEIALPDNKGVMRRLTELNGKVVLLDFHVFASSGSTERIMMLRDLYNKYHDRGLEIFQVSLDPDEHFWKTQTAALPWINVRDNDGVNSVLIRQYNIQSIPTFFLVTKGNELYKRDEQMKDLEAEIRSLL